MTGPAQQIDIVCNDTYMEMIAVRSALEYWDAQVTLHLIGPVTDLIHLFDGSTPLSDHVILLTDGGENGGLALAEMCAELEAQQPYHKELTPSNLSEFASLDGKTVICTGCSLGTQEWADAFLGAGCAAYVGAVDDPEGNAALFYVLHLHYEFLALRRPLAKAHAHARSHDPDTGMFTLYQQ